MRRKNKMKKACTFFRKMRLTYPLVIAMAVVYYFRPFNLILFALAYTFFGMFFDILCDTIWVADKVESLRKGKVVR